MSKLLTVVSATPTVDTSANISGDVLGTLMTFNDAILAGTGIAKLKRVWITDTSKQSANVDLFLFGSNPTASTITTNTPFACPAADLVRIVNIVHITTHSVASATGVSYIDLDRSIRSATPVAEGGYTLYGVLVSRGTPTYASTSALTVYLEIENEC